ncbi:hypothetical protein NC661_17785 [Aquibacillus koreensis]|uniref:Uncharacterized protein n=1 Tax=Aquibacillus koreensis TaxID=279446 RepID=A0A9X3WNX8_9BACI|nr:hypothetical protein [Aquibacillus koreensis]MCT2534903.1 hypothetical protein [Aquibacillus koreensis]MDC3422203.1 hypothetical protein [Aquibacillus koreensis]
MSNRIRDNLEDFIGEEKLFTDKDKRNIYSRINSIKEPSSKNTYVKRLLHAGLLVAALCAFFLTIYVTTDQKNLNEANIPLEQINDNNVRTIHTYLEKEFTGPGQELSDILDQGLYSVELERYLEENYDDLVADLEQMINRNYVLSFLRAAHTEGYQLQPKDINIQQIEDTKNDVYNYEVEVEYSKNNEANTATVTGVINLNENGKISLIRRMDGLELFEGLN